MGALEGEEKNQALISIREALVSQSTEIFEANQRDLSAAKKDGVADPLIKRLKFDAGKLQEVLGGIETLIAMPDPVGTTISAKELDSGLELYQVSCPIGVIGVIFESRPDALVQISSLCLKSGNCVILKGGSEATETNRALADAITKATSNTALPAGWIQLAETRGDVREMLALDGMIDLLVPRGSNEFVRFIMDNTNIPVLGHADGICHVYVHNDADVEAAVAIALDSKIQYVAVCNAAETLLVHREIAGAYLPELKKAMDAHSVLLKGCEITRGFIDVEPATEDDWKSEYLDLILSIRIVEGIEEAAEHISTYGSHHTDSIVTKSRETADWFMTYVDSANVFWNCSTRFSDGYRYGLGAEVGIGTGKIHARGPVGVEGLLTYKWKLYGNGHTVADYSGPAGRSFTHRPITEA